MRNLISVFAGVAGLGLFVGSIASGAVVPGAGATTSARGAKAIALRSRPKLRSHQPPSPTPCSSNYPSTSFNAVHGVSDHAGGDDSAVLGGTNNEACGQSASVSGGDYNIAGHGATESFIGGGYFNAVSGTQSGMLAGDGNNVAAQDSGIGAGYSNYVYGGGTNSFIAAGNSNVITGDGVFIGAGQANSADGDSAVVAGFNNTSDAVSFVGAGSDNNALGSGSGVVTGYDNQVSGPAYGSLIGAGGALLEQAGLASGKSYPGNVVTGQDSFIAAGDENLVSGNGSIVGGGGAVPLLAKVVGLNNQIAGNDSFVGAGDGNSIGANQAFIGSGQSNSIAAGATYSVIAGGRLNTAGNLGAAVGGGRYNDASGAYATIPGGYDNVASGIASFAAGNRAQALATGSFVWSDSASSTVLVVSKVPNQFIARAIGGVAFYSNTALTSGVLLAPGAGTWSNLSDRRMKKGIVPLDDAGVLAKVAALPISEWSYRSEGGVRHVGPMAQDFYAAFRVGEDDRHITSIDEDGVALAAIKALHAENAKTNADNRSLHSENIALRNRLAALEQKVATLAAGRFPR
jgi:hypothetical protein